MNGRRLVKSTLETRLSSYVKSGPTSNGLCRTLSIQKNSPPLHSAGGTFRQAGSGPTSRKTSVPPRFGVCAPRAARSRDGEERDGDRRQDGYSASHQFSAFQSGLQGTKTKFRTEVSYAAVKTNWKSGIVGTSLASPRSALLKTRARSTLVEDPVGLVEVRGDESLAVAGVVLGASQP